MIIRRRGFVAAVAASSLFAEDSTPAVLGGTPIRKQKKFPSWPVMSAQEEERQLLEVLRSKHWNRGSAAAKFEKMYAELTGAKHCLAVANGTSALITSLGILGIGPGDEVIVPPYTFVATINAVLLFGAMPVFVDVDPDTFQIDHNKIAATVTPQTAAIIPVHIGGGAANIDGIMATAVRHRLPVIEDACQSHLAEWKGRKVGTFGVTGCFSFQASKNLNCGEGGAVITSNDQYIERAFTYHNNGRGRSPLKQGDTFVYDSAGANLRLTDLQAALLLAQMTRLEQQSKVRETNAAHLTSLLREIPGIKPATTAAGCTRNAYHLYMFRYDAAQFDGLTRAQFLKAMQAEGIPASGGYSPLNKEPFLKSRLTSRGFARVYTKERVKAWDDANALPVNDKLCKEAVWFTQTMLLGDRSDMDEIAAAVRRIRKNAAAIRTKLA